MVFTFNYPKFSRLMILGFVVLLGGVVSAKSYAEDAPKLVREENHFNLSYKIDIPPAHEFWISIRDAVRAGQTAEVRHKVQMREENTFFGGRVAKAEAAKYISYNLFENTYSYGKDPQAMRQTTRLGDVQNFLFGADLTNFVQADKLKKATVYDIRIRLSLDENIHTQGLMFFDTVFNQKLTRHFTHVAR